MDENDWLSRKFWEKVMGIICFIMVIVYFPILYFTSILSIAFLPSLGSIPFWIMLVLLIGLWYKAYMGMNGELDRRFPPLNKSNR